MKTLFYFELAFLAIIDLLLLFALTGSLSVRIWELIVVACGIVGPIQLLTAFSMLFWKRFWSDHFIIYLLLTVLVGLLFIIGSHHLISHDLEKTISISLMFFCFGLAHYFVYVLYDLSRLKITKQFS